MKKFGLIGYPVSHSFSKRYFTEKFEKLGISETHSYSLFELKNIQSFPSLWEDLDLVGINVTVPHKQAVLAFLDDLDNSAKKVGAVNVIKRQGSNLIGYNSDYYGFKKSLESFMGSDLGGSALVLGGGGAAKAVFAALEDFGIDYKLVSRSKDKGDFIYDDLLKDPSIVQNHKLIINTTPLGMHPKLDQKPDLPYQKIGAEHYLFDLVYNPEQTAFMKSGLSQKAHVINGLEMLYLQADKAWEIWNS